MEPGFVEGESNSFGPTSVVWQGQQTDYLELAPLPLWGWSKSPRLPGYRCATCHLVEIDYGTPPPP
jgi:hypothetical protein